MKSIRVLVLLSLAMLPADAARAGLIFGQVNYGSVTANVDRNGAILPLNGTGFSAHAGANVGGAFANNGNGRWILAGGTSDIQHDPAQTGAPNTTFPADYISVVANPRTFAPVPPIFPKDTSYTTTPKVDGAPDVTTAMKAMGGTTASATASITFSSDNKGNYKFDSSGSNVKITRGAKTPSGNAANTIIDPWTTSSSVQLGDVLGGSLSLSASDFMVTINGEPNGVVMSSMTIGTDFPSTTVPGSSAPGLDSEGLPIVLQLSMDFFPGQLLNPSISVIVDPSYQFFNPDTNAPIAPIALTAYLTGRIDSALQLDLVDDPTGNTVDLKSDVTLLDWAGTAMQSGSIVSIDDVEATLAQTDLVPEPATLGMAATAALVGLGYHVRARRKRSA